MSLILAFPRDIFSALATTEGIVTVSAIVIIGSVVALALTRHVDSP